MNTTRRSFLKKASLGGLVVLPAILPSSVFASTTTPPPSERITLGFIGVGGQGTFLLRSFLKKTDAQVVAVCDVHTERRERAKSIVKEAYSERFGAGAYRGCDTYNDFRDVLSRDDIDAVVIAVPDNWHAIPAVMAADAGKDIPSGKAAPSSRRSGGTTGCFRPAATAVPSRGSASAARSFGTG